MAYQEDIALMAHLMRRAAFGVPYEELEARVAQGYEATVDLVAGRTTRFEPLAAGLQPPIMMDEFSLSDRQVEAILNMRLAKLTGGVRANTVIIGGELEGNIDAAARVELLESGVLNGDLKAGSLTVAAGSRMRGQVEFGWEGKAGQKPLQLETGTGS
jgi:hypothetical protein